MTRKKRGWLLISSLALNGVLVIYFLSGLVYSWYLDKTNALLYAKINSSQEYFCEIKYEEMLRMIDESLDGKNEAAAKFSFAANICGKNYKTGEYLNIKSLVEQVNNTPPKTNIQYEYDAQ